MIPKNYTPTQALRSQSEELVLLPFNTQPQANDRFYLPMNSELDNSLIVGIETHSYTNILGGFPYDFPQTIQINGVSYNVITYAELASLTITIVDKNRRQSLCNYPAAALFNQVAPGSTTGFSTKKYTKFSLSILSGESFVTWTQNSVTATPFVLPITFFYNEC